MKELNVDYGSHVQKDQVLATLEIPELQLQVKEDDAAIKNAAAQIPHAQDELNRMQAQQKVLQLQFDRLNGVAQIQAGPGGAAGSGRFRGQGAGLGGAGGSGQVESAIRRKRTRGRASQAGARSGAVRLRENHGAVRGRGDAALTPISAR